MFRGTVLAVASAFALSSAPVFAADANPLEAAPPPAPYQQVSKLVKLPDFIPGLGTLYVDPSKLPAGPFLAYDHDGKLAATVYMVPFKALSDGTAFDDLAVGDTTVTSVDVVYNAGHPGVEEPHAHIILYNSADSKERLAK